MKGFLWISLFMIQCPFRWLLKGAPMSPRFSLLRSIYPRRLLAVAIAYLMAGKLGLLLAIPPGYATAIFPASGIALAALLQLGYALWPGIFLGSVALNIWVSWNSQGILSGPSLAMAVGIGLGSTLQAILGTFLVKRFVGFPTALIHEKEIFLFLILAGPVACLVGASVGTGVLLLAHAIQDSHALISGWTWWVGDVMGVLVTLPILLTFLGNPSTVWRQRRLSVALPLAALLPLILFIFIRASAWENTQIRLKFQNQTGNLAHNMQVNFAGYLQSITAIERFYASSSHVNREEFRVFTATAFQNFPGIQALEWIPKVTDEQRDGFEKSAQQEGLYGFQIQETQQGVMVPAAKRSIYFPVFYVEPWARNKKALGFDLASNPARRAALEQAQDSGQQVATRRITLVQEKQNQFAFLVFHPVFRGGVMPETVAARRQALQGFALGVFRIGDMIHIGLRALDQQNIHLQLLDSDAPEQEQNLLPLEKISTERPYPGLTWTFPLDMAGRRWLLRFWGTPAYAQAHSTGYVWAVLAFGLLFVSLAGTFLLVITGRSARIEELVWQRTRQLKDSEARMRTIVETAVDAIITISDRGIIESVNSAAARLFAYTADEMIGHNVAMLTPSPHREQHDNYLKNYITSGKARIIGTSREVEGVRQDGVRIPLALSVSDVYLADRRIFTGILHDLTERKKADTLKNEFVSTVSHELRTPLTAIKGSLGLVVGGVLGPIPTKPLALLKKAVKNTDRLTFLINDLLDMEKIQSGDMTFQMSQISVATLLKNAVSANQGYADRFHIPLVLQLPKDPFEMWISGDENRLLQVLANLLSNAIKFSPENSSVILSVTHPMARERGDVTIAVTDHGQGIPEAFRERIFEKFAQADGSNTRKVSGTGLGLAISKTIVEKHGGNIGYTTTMEQGTTFYFTLPLIKKI